jgi:broad specificity phosphatase PhoE
VIKAGMDIRSPYYRFFWEPLRRGCAKLHLLHFCGTASGILSHMSALPPLHFIILGLCVIVLLLFVLFRMRTKRFYFIRHGETLLNAKGIRQGPEGALSEKGRDQAKQVGEALKKLPIRRIFTSTYPRAEETARIINEYLHVPIIPSALLAERKNPSEIIGKSTHDPKVKEIAEKMDESYHGDEYRFSDEENFIDLKKRAEKCLDLFALHGAHQTAVVTHHHFLKMLIAYMLYHERLHAADFAKVAFFNFSDNAGVTTCLYHPWRMFNKTHGWEVVGFNERVS